MNGSLYAITALFMTMNPNDYTTSLLLGRHKQCALEPCPARQPTVHPLMQVPELILADLADLAG